ncbi:uncharacterized protein PV09_05547 [Verruconis gallopava]|uniref:Alpha/beta hydrolase fold-3 domain-containing protein n=1 Tax=Verruconis gallopava TaxID=253628 RepID=A0A0D1YRT8_9PEZI|nr:uncharacterized protein PV09_05547 [Verruconis gallopava]KIW03337.1 hypothetical protein PV09_05547 [Verruconis gallopava]
MSVSFRNMSSTATDGAPPKPSPAVAEMTTQDKRAAMHAMIQAAVAKLPALPDTLEEFEIQVPAHDGWQSPTKIVRPRTHVDADRSLIVHFYGGGMIVGEPDQLLSVARTFAGTYGAVVALPSYRLVPDVRFPIQAKDAWEVLVWLSRNAEAELGAKLDNGFIVGGVSAGAALASVCGGLAMFPDAADAQEAPMLAKPLTGQFLSVPSVAMDETVPIEYKQFFTSRDENRHVDGFNTSALDDVFRSLGCDDYRSLWFSPFATLVQREPVNKIPTYLDCCGLDPLRDDAIVYEKVLKSRGVPTKLYLFSEDKHSSWTTLDAPTKARAPTIKEAQMEGMKWLLTRPL